MKSLKSLDHDDTSSSEVLSRARSSFLKVGRSRTALAHLAATGCQLQLHLGLSPQFSAKARQDQHRKGKGVVQRCSPSGLVSTSQTPDVLLPIRS